MKKMLCLFKHSDRIRTSACTLLASHRVRVLVCGLSGLPWVGGSGGLMLEVNIEPGGRPRWLVLPHAHGPNVNVKVSHELKHSYRHHSVEILDMSNKQLRHSVADINASLTNAW